MDYRKSLQLQAYEYIKNLILSEKLQYNEIYSETKIAKEMGISRTPMRDALQYLSQERYIDILPNKGFCLHKMSMTDFIETYQMRTAIEGYCARQLTLEATDPKHLSTFQQLEDCLEIQKLALQQTPKDFFHTDYAFHLSIIDSISNQEATSLFQTYLYRMEKLAVHTLSYENRMQEAYLEHQELFQLIKTGNISKIYEAVVNHMESPHHISPEIIESVY